MKCPVCQVPLMPAERHGVPTDFCPRCWGVWLDRGELDAIVRRALGCQGESRWIDAPREAVGSFRPAPMTT